MEMCARMLVKLRKNIIMGVVNDVFLQTPDGASFLQRLALSLQNNDTSAVWCIWVLEG